MATGMRTRYTDATIQKRSVADVIKMIEWTEAPLLHLLGCDKGNAKKFRLTNFPSQKIEWLEDDMSPRSSTLTAGINNSVVSVPVADGSLFKTGDIIGIGTELMYVASVATNTLTVTRAFGGSTAASHSSAAPVHLRTIARLEGAEATTGHTTVVSAPHNFSQIFEEAVKVSGTQELISDYGISDTLGYHVAKLIGGGQGIGTRGKAGKLAILLAQTFWHGRRAQGSASAPRAMGGFKSFVTSNVVNKASEPVERVDVLDMMQAIYLAGGSPDTIVTSAWGLRKINQWFDGFITTERSETRGGSKITTVVTDFGDLEVTFDRWAPNDHMAIIEKDKMGWLPLREFFVEPMAKTGDYDWVDILGEYTFALCNETAHGYIHNFATNK